MNEILEQLLKLQRLDTAIRARGHDLQQIPKKSKLIDDKVRSVREPEGKVTIAVVGKYTVLLDAYKSLSEALTHGGIANHVGVTMEWISSDRFTDLDTAVKLLAPYDALITPTLTRPAVRLGTLPSNLEDGIAELFAWLVFTFPFNATGQPAMSVPR